MANGINVYQINLQHCEAATDTLMRELEETKGPYIALIQEPYVVRGAICKLHKIGNVEKGVNPKQEPRGPRACIVSSPDVNGFLLPQFSGRDITTMYLNNAIVQGGGRRASPLIVTSVYMAAEEPAPTQMLEDLARYCEAKKIPLVVGADANAHHTAWGSTDINARGESLLEFIASTDLEIMNRGSKPTFVHANRREVLDITLATMSIADEVEDWRVSEKMSLSDHNTIQFVLGRLKKTSESVRNPRKTDWAGYTSMVEETFEKSTWKTPRTVEEIELQVSRINNILTKAFQTYCPKHRKGKKSLPPWPAKIKELQAKARQAQRRAHATGLLEDFEKKREAQRTFQREQRKFSEKSWQDFCTATIDMAPAARLARILRDDNRNQVGMMRIDEDNYTNSPEEAIDLLLKEHFPEARVEDGGGIIENHSPMSIMEGGRVITFQRVKRALKSFGPYKAPGLDGIYPAMLHKGGKRLHQVLTGVMTACLTLGYVPEVWRKTKVVFLPKPGKARYDSPNSFRPVSLTSFLLKTMEKVIELQIFGEKNHRNMHRNQHAYRKGRSTETALHQLIQRLERTINNKEAAMVAYLDIEGAFNRVTFLSMEQAMKKFGMSNLMVRWVSHMLRNRSVEAEIKGCRRTRLVERGCPQGGVLSPRLWNMVIDELLEVVEREHPGIHIQAYADDVTMVSEGFDENTVSNILQSALETVQRWCNQKGLSVNPRKTELVSYTGKTKWNPPAIRLEGEEIPVKSQAKYLGVIIDKRLSWTPHVREKTKKTINALAMCRRAVGKTWGLKPRVMRWIYTGIIRPMLAYGGLVWATNLDQTKIRELTKVQRLACCMTTGALHTTPTAAMEIILQLPSIDCFLQGEAIKTAYRLKLEGQWTVPRPQVNRKSHHTRCDNLMGDIPEMSMPSDQIPATPIGEKLYETSIADRSEAAKKGEKIQEGAWTIFTDGSRTQNKTGAAYVIRRPDGREIKHKWHLGNMATVYQAELQAISRSAKNVRKMAPLTRKILFFSDSQASIKALENDITKSKMVKECHDVLQSLGKRYVVELNWVPGHQGVPGNEAADTLAKQGAQMEWYGPEPALPVPKDRVRTKVNERVKQISESRFWRANRYRESRKQVRIQTPKDLKDLINLTRRELRKIVAILTGHNNLRVHLKRMKLTQDDRCHKCRRGIEDANHLMGSCPAYWRERITCLGSLSFSLEEWTALRYTRIAKFLIQVGRLEERLEQA